MLKWLGIIARTIGSTLRGSYWGHAGWKSNPDICCAIGTIGTTKYCRLPPLDSVSAIDSPIHQTAIIAEPG